MKKLIIFCSLLFVFASCKKNEEPIVEIQTTEGAIKVKLYKETPLHRDNFVKLVNKGYYDGQVFHRVMKNFLIQTGDPNSKEADHNRLLGTGGPGYTIPAEIRYPQIFHKRGVLSAARLPDENNPNKESNGSQFCFILGKKYTSAELDTIERDAYNKQLDLIWQRLVVTNRKRIDDLSLRSDDKKKLQALEDSLTTLAEKQMKKEHVFFFTKKQREAYTTVGGVPFMDKDYTIFGEVIQGLDVLEKIERMPVDVNARPKKDVRIIVAKVIN
jgi:cyclophilin family peptidyl-prolyl cis-trans isomerase